MKRKGVLIRIAKSKTAKVVAVKTALLMVFQLGIPTYSFALTSGPAQEEFASFEPAETSDMVDLYTGDFTYNIPLLSVPGPQGGYPINMAYHGGIGMEQEASWVGLGWNLNVGAISRQLQGVPDDFSGDEITYQMDQKKSTSVELDFSDALNNPVMSDYDEILGLDPSFYGLPSLAEGVNANVQLYYNNYRGVGYRLSYTPDMKMDAGKILEGSVGVSLSVDSQNGIGIAPNLSVGAKIKGKNRNLQLSTSINNRTGVSGLNISASSTYRYMNGANRSYNSSSSSISFGKQVDIQSASMPIRRVVTPFSIITSGNYSVTPNIGGEWTSSFPGAWKGSLSYSYLADKGKQSRKSYGFLYHNEKGETEEDFKQVLDVSRDNSLSGHKNPYLSPSRISYDHFVMSGQGAGGSFRAMTNGIPEFYTAQETEKTKAVNLGIEGASGSGFHLGLNGNFNSAVTTSGEWSSGLDESDGNWQSGQKGIAHIGADKKMFFKNYGEHTGVLTTDDNLNSWSGDEAVKVKVDKSTGWLKRTFVATDEIVTDELSTGSHVYNNSSMQETKSTERRASMIEYLNNDQADLYGVTRHLRYSPVTGSTVSKTFNRKSHHISEIQSTQPNGMRYIYGIPAYNEFHYDVSMSVDDQGDHNTKLVDLNATTYQGTEGQYFNRVEKPEYAHSWLLSSVLSPDYFDVDAIEGPSDGDLGYWTRFNYNKITSPGNNYKWRIPYQQANFVEGNIGDPDDNTAYFSYGEKEVYYVQSVETKTHIAVFHTSARKDGLEAYGEYAGEDDKGSLHLHKLDKIELFSKAEYYVDGAINTNAIPLQTVHFEYDYSLCKDIPNNSDNYSGGVFTPNGNATLGGKLTLKKVYYTYEKSDRGSQSPYAFTYASGTTGNPKYNPRNADRWGMFKDNGQYGANPDYPYINFPFTEQDEDYRTEDPGTWCLKEVDLPTGGTFTVEYEFDDYAYEENKDVMRMFDIVGVGNEIDVNDEIDLSEYYSCASGCSASTQTSIPDRSGTGVAGSLANVAGGNDDLRVYFQLEENYTTGDKHDFIMDNYVKDIKHLWFRTYSYLKVNQNNDLHKDFVEGYAELDLTATFGVAESSSTSGFDLGYVVVKKVPIGNHGSVNSHPFQKAAIQHMKLARPKIAHDNFMSNAGTTTLSPITFVAGVITNLEDIVASFTGYNKWSKLKGCGKYIELNGKSIVRLMDPDQTKIGGGYRVKQFTLNDNWVNSTTQESFYGQEYDYTLEKEDGTRMTSGVAYEPQIGNQESALTAYVEFEENVPLASNYNVLVQTPLLKDFYPSPSVGYSQVTVKSIAPIEADKDAGATPGDDNEIVLQNSSAPFTTYNFYTGKDYPIYTDETDQNSEPNIVRPIIIPGVYVDFAVRRGRSQGYSIVLNDMPGKMKSVEQFTRKYIIDGGVRKTVPGSSLTKTEYTYQTHDEYQDGKVNKLNSQVKVLNADGTYDYAYLGQTVDIHIDRHENKMESTGGGLDLNLEMCSGIFLPMPIPQVEHSEVLNRKIVMNKVIHRSAILKEVKVTTDQSTIVTENLAYDIETGGAILTKVTNEHEDPIYSFSQPAHWNYDNMGPAYENEDYSAGFVSTTITGGDLTHTNIDETKFNIGDEVYLTSADIVATVVDNSVNETLTLIDHDGEFVDGVSTTKVTVVRSAKRNLLGTSAGSIVAKTYTETTSPDTYSFADIINASAVEFSDQWQSDEWACNTGDGAEMAYNNMVGETVNPYQNGMAGNWRVKESYAYLDKRDYSNNSREDGTYNTFTPFDWSGGSNSDWTSSGKVNKVSPHGFGVEDEDAIGRKSAATYGYKNSLVTATGANMGYNEIAFDGYEDYETTSCSDDHFRFKNIGLNQSGQNTISSDEAHTGSYSLRIQPSSNEPITTSVLDPNYCDTYTRTYDLSGSGDYSVLNACDVIGVFAPYKSKKYVVSAWVKENHDVSGYDDLSIEISFTGSATTYTFSPEGHKIEEWQRIYGEFDIPTGATAIFVKYINDGTVAGYFDDVRLHPALGNMTSFVYNPVNLKMEAQLDANNFATFYIYDEAGNLVLVKKETTEGIQTIQEGRVSTYMAQ